MKFPRDIQGPMRDCILQLLWAKDDIVAFFSNNGCTKSDIASLGVYKDLSRAKIIDNLFNKLSSRADNGLGQFRAMLHALINWSYYDPYYFDNLKKLNREEAERGIQHLKQIQEIRDHKIKEARRRESLN